MSCQTRECQSYANLVVDVLNNQEQPLGESLKNLLGTLPRTDLSADILKTALLQFADSNPASCRWAIWILQNSDELKPYFYLIEESLDLIVKKLENQGICLT
ncbi:MAG TPA: hypothetical protein DCE56_42215 [Cyanobacteria bacterium UBA8553]|nr:hypothetical protein [Cyanobacteria bacterium UBA8553]HAJ59003.1 hypothetical protein [Cyanobacteria bacterium UBA8543]